MKKYEFNEWKKELEKNDPNKKEFEKANKYLLELKNNLLTEFIETNNLVSLKEKLELLHDLKTSPTDILGTSNIIGVWLNDKTTKDIENRKQRFINILTRETI